MFLVLNVGAHRRVRPLFFVDVLEREDIVAKHADRIYEIIKQAM